MLITRFELITGQLPFTTKHIPDLIEEKRKFTITKQTLPKVSEDLVYILGRMVKFEVDQRIDSEQVLFETSRLMNNLSIPK